MTCSLMRRSVRNLGRRSPLARTLDAFKLVGPKRISVAPLGPRAANSGPDDANGHSWAQIGEALAGKLGSYVVAVAGGIDYRADLHHVRAQCAGGIAHEDQADGRAVHGTRR